MPDGAWNSASAAARDAFVLTRRGRRPQHDPWRAQGLTVEDERSAGGRIARTATVFLTGRECPWRCVMCDLWQHTTEADTPHGAIPAQIAAARRTLEERPDRVTQLKLYNAGSFFDPAAVPEADYPAIASHLTGLDRVIVESHPALVGRRLDRFMAALETDASTRPPMLEVAMGLETAHPGALSRLHKRMSLDQFSLAAAALRERGVDLRVFLLIAPPFIPAAAQDEWLLRSVDTAFACGAAVVSLVPTRTGNGALDALTVDGLFQPPALEDIERSLELGHGHTTRGRVLLDLWDLDRFSRCEACFGDRRDRLHAMNLEQRVLPRVACRHCCPDRPS